MAQPRLINLGVGALLRTPVLHRVGSSYVMLLSFSGRKTGRLYTVPVGYFRDGGVVLTTNDDRWWRNLADPAPVSMLLQRRQYTGMGQAITDLSPAVDGMAALVAGCPRYGKWLKVGSTADGHPSRDDLAREVRNGRVLIHISDVVPAKGRARHRFLQGLLTPPPGTSGRRTREGRPISHRQPGDDQHTA